MPGSAPVSAPTAPATYAMALYLPKIAESELGGRLPDHRLLERGDRPGFVRIRRQAARESREHEQGHGPREGEDGPRAADGDEEAGVEPPPAEAFADESDDGRAQGHPDEDRREYQTDRCSAQAAVRKARTDDDASQSVQVRTGIAWTPRIDAEIARRVALLLVRYIRQCACLSFGRMTALRLRRA